MIKIPLEPHKVEHYEAIRDGAKYGNLKLTVTLDLGSGDVAKGLAETVAVMAVQKGLAEKAETGTGKAVFGLVTVHLLTLKGSARGVALAILALNSSVNPEGKDRR
jgi:hypothetical protein